MFNYGLRFYENRLILNTQDGSGWGKETDLPFSVNYNVTFTLKLEIGKFYVLTFSSELILIWNIYSFTTLQSVPNSMKSYLNVSSICNIISGSSFYKVFLDGELLSDNGLPVSRSGWFF